MGRPRAVAQYHIDAETGCYVWDGPVDRHGYGRQGNISAHRHAWEMVNGPIPSGLQIDHLCRVRRCVNPAHLEAVTYYENVMRGESFAAINARKTQCINGHAFDQRNTYIRPNGRRDCRCCINQRQARAKRKRELAV